MMMTTGKEEKTGAHFLQVGILVYQLSTPVYIPFPCHCFFWELKIYLPSASEF